MCIIIVKPAGHPLPSKETLISCIRRNPDGFGFATPKQLYHTLNAAKFIKAVTERISDAEPAIIHCRIATNGSVKERNCHPFIDKQSGIKFAHNGILHNAPIVGDETDSEAAFKRYYMPVIRKYGYKSRELAAAVRDTIGSSKFAFLNRNGEMQMYGNFFELDGCFFSNLNFSTPYSPIFGATCTTTATAKKAGHGKVGISRGAYKALTQQMKQMPRAERVKRQAMYETLFAPYGEDMPDFGADDFDAWREQP